MPPLRRKSFNTTHSKKTERTKYSKQPKTYEVQKILSCRLMPEAINTVQLQFLVTWQGYGPESNSWEPLESLRLNTVFINYINEKFREFEADIFVNIANIKEKIKYSRRKALREQLKVVIMKDVFPFDPFEYKVHQVVYQLISDRPKRFKTYMEDLVYRNHFFKLDEVQRIECDNLAKLMSEKEGIKITIENDIDFETPPKFNYVSQNVCSEELMITYDTTLLTEDIDAQDKIEGCKCKSCSKDSECCPKLLNLPFPYKEKRNTRVVALKVQEPLIECNDNCKCDKNCLNRATQQERALSLCLFKTQNSGWGVRTLAPIKASQFILEYTGEILGNAEAGKRANNAYLFDLNMDRLSHGYYTIDALEFGNLGRFVNHSCDPNCSMWIVSDCTKNLKNQKLCIFALRNIEADEEITIDYSPLESVPTSDRINFSETYLIECNCGSKLCRGDIKRQK